MTMTIDDYKIELNNEVRAVAEATSDLCENAFFEFITDILVAAGDIDTADRCFFVKRGMRIDGYGGDPIDTENILTIFVCDYDPASASTQIKKADIETVCKRAANFISSCRSSQFFHQLDESSPEYGLADLIRQRWDLICKIRIVFLTNKLLSLRKTTFDPIPIDGVNAQFSCWDLARLHSFSISGKEKEPVQVALADYGGGLAVLPAHTSESELKSYLCVMPAFTLAQIYEEYGTQLLEKNVRVFLQAKGGVNKGIRASIEECPSRFFAYNNGITATADAIETSLTNHGICLNKISDFQIVNGGQTTASIYEAHRRGISLEQVYVQMKLTVVSPERSIELVPLISKYANSQNRVTEADFFSNHPFHVDFEKLSRRIISPPRGNSTAQTYWFYERARGQFANAKNAVASKSERKKFDLINPRDQLITKTDLAKALNAFRGHPHIVSKGAQASFKFFAEDVKEKWDKQIGPTSFVNEKFFRDCISRLIVFRGLEKQVSLQDWYQGGYRANIVYYSLAKLIDCIKRKGKVLDYSKIWASQEVPESLMSALLDLAEAAHNHLTAPPPGSPANVCEYAKTEKCWTLFKAVTFILPRSIDYLYVLKSVDSLSEKQAVRVAKQDTAIELQSILIGKGAKYWSGVLEYCSQNNLVTQKDWVLLSRASQFPGRLLDSDAQYQSLQKLLDRAIGHGYKA